MEHYGEDSTSDSQWQNDWPQGRSLPFCAGHVLRAGHAQRSIDTKEAVGQYAFSIVTWSMFSSDGTMFHCTFLNGHICLSFCKKGHDKGSTMVVRYEMMWYHFLMKSTYMAKQCLYLSLVPMLITWPPVSRTRSDNVTITHFIDLGEFG